MSNKKTKEEWLFELYDSGKKPKEVAELTTYALKTCERYYTEWRQINGEGDKSSLKNNKIYEQAVKLFEKGVPRKDISKELNRSISSICKYYKRWINTSGANIPNNSKNKLNNKSPKKQVPSKELNGPQEYEDNLVQTSLIISSNDSTSTLIDTDSSEDVHLQEGDKSFLKNYYVGDIVFVDKNNMLPENDNGVLNANRPAVVVKASNSSSHTVIVIYITKHVRRLDLTKNIKLTTPTFKYESMLVCDQIQVVSKKHVNKIGELNKEDKAAIKQALIETFDLVKNIKSVHVKSFSTDLATYEIDDNGDILMKIGNEMIIIPSNKLRALGEEFIYIKENVL